MKVSVEKLPTSEAVLDIEVSWDEMQTASDKAYRKLVKKVDIQGFRRGKAPRSILERRLGKEYIYQEGLDDLISEAYSSALKEHELTPITQPKLDAPVFEMGQPYHFSLTVPVITPVELGDYSDLHFEREDASVTSEEVDKELSALRERATTWETVERPADYDDRVTVDLKLTVEEKSISDLKDNPFELTRERVGLFTGMDEEVVGMQAGESKSFSTVIPQDYSNEKLAGKQADYEITLYKVEAKHQPEMDDAFAAQASEGQFETFEDLSKGLSDSIQENKKRKNNEELRNKVVDAVIEKSTFSIHPLLIDEEADEILHQLSHMLEPQHISLDQYLMMMRKTREEYLAEIRPDAEHRIKRQLVLDEVANREQIGVEAEEIEALVNYYSQVGQPLPQNESQMRAFMLSYRREKALSKLVEMAAGPDPDLESESDAEEMAVEENAEAAAIAGETISSEAHNVTSETSEDEPSAITTSTDETSAEIVE